MLAIEIIIVFFGFLYIVYLIGGGKDNEVGGFGLVFAVLLIIFVPYFIYKITNNALIALALFVIVPLAAALMPQDLESERKRANSKAFDVMKWLNKNGYDVKLKHAQFLVSHFQSPINTKINPNPRDTYTWLYENVYYDYRLHMTAERAEQALGVLFDDFARKQYNDNSMFNGFVIRKIMLMEGLKKPPFLRVHDYNIYKTMYDNHVIPKIAKN